MKAIRYSFVLGMLGLLAVAATLAGPNDQYCAKLKDGMIVVLKGETQIAADVVLANGTRVQTDGVVVKKDGSKLVLKDGDCVDKEGNLVDTKAREKTINQKQQP